VWLSSQVAAIANKVKQNKVKPKYLMDAAYLRLCSQQTAADELRQQ